MENFINQKPIIILVIVSSSYGTPKSVRVHPVPHVLGAHVLTHRGHPPESLFQTSVKAFRLQEGEETILVFDSHSDNQQS